MRIGRRKTIGASRIAMAEGAGEIGLVCESEPGRDADMACDEAAMDDED
jgi:hypothetical protein